MRASTHHISPPWQLVILVTALAAGGTQVTVSGEAPKGIVAQARRMGQD